MSYTEYNNSILDLEENTDDPEVAYSKFPLITCTSTQTFREELRLRLRENSFE